MSFITNIQREFNKATIVEKIIYINVALYLIMLFGKSFIANWFTLASSFNIFLSQPWTIFTYGFFHINFPHILFNLIFLFYIGDLFLNFFTIKQFLNYYFLGILFGGISFLILNPGGYLIGASAGLMAILVGISVKIPTYEIRFNLIGSVKLWIIAAIYIGISIIGLESRNSGGNMAHLGGALLGFIYTKQLEKGNDIGKYFENIIGFFTSLFKPKQKKTLRTVHKKSSIKRKPTAKESSTQQKQIDSILDKISKSGYESLSKDEKDFLFKVGK